MGGAAPRDTRRTQCSGGLTLDLRRVFNTAGLRRTRYDRIAEMLDIRPSDRILDVGCGKGGGSVASYNRTNEIVGVDLFDPDELSLRQANFSYVQGDACDLKSLSDKSFDVAISIGMLEHIRPRERLLAAIRETQRVACRYCFVVPHKYAFVEPHFQMPFFSLWPDGLKSFLIKRFTLGTQTREPSGRWQRINWLSRREWSALFNDSGLVIESHWYGPLMQYYLIFGGVGIERAKRRANDVTRAIGNAS
jgi:SAM-dependent methyltransferase